jgi:glycosyltransferase involved in cell wall biosynthesis
MCLISIIIPTFNREKLLERAINSVMLQTFKDFECIVIDDGSTDHTESLPVFKNYVSKIKYLKLSSNSGVSKARNTGVALSKGQWIAFLDSDDEWKPQKLEKQITWHKQHPDYLISQSKEIWIRKDKRVNPPKTHEKIEGYIFNESLKRCMITPSSVMMLRKLFIDSGGFNENFPVCEDYDLWLRITCKYKIGLIKEYLLTRYSGHLDQLSSSMIIPDKFRIKSIIDLLNCNVLNQEQMQEAKKELIRKANIVANGYKKRGNLIEYERYSEIIKQYSQ